MICILCNQNILSTKGISSHLRSAHQITTKQYYDRYLKKPNEGICPICGKLTTYYNFTKGYNQHCSVKCANADPIVIQKLISTNQKKYGVNVGFQTKQCQESSHSKLSMQKHNNTMIKRYGTKRYNSPEVIEKIKQTNLKKYGVTNPLCISKVRTKALIAAQSDLAKQKRHDTRKSNGWNTFTKEKYVLTKLDELHIEYKYNYKSENYPWKVDFYLIHQNIFIELNLNWSHGDHWFNKSNKDDIKKLKYWKSKDSDYYKNAIKTWINRDIQKRDWAIKHKLNYIVVWNNDQINLLLNDIANKKSLKGFIDYNEV